MPEHLGGYSDFFILAVLFPILENAVEASREGASIAIRHRFAEDAHRLSVTSQPLELPPPGEAIYGDGYSTKGGLHQGLGLAMVRRLLANDADASIAHMTGDDTVTFEIVLPGRADER